jgi:hypothetical protein
MKDGRENVHNKKSRRRARTMSNMKIGPRPDALDLKVLNYSDGCCLEGLRKSMRTPFRIIDVLAVIRIGQKIEALMSS